MAFSIATGSAQAQILDNIMPDSFDDAMTKGSVETGFGFAALRYEDKKRMQRLRARYRELNPQFRGVVEIYDVDEGFDDSEPVENDATSEPQAQSEASDAPPPQSANE